MDVLELTAFEWMKIAIMMSNGWHGPYNVFLKPQDLFLISLQAPNHYFCQMFWSVQFLWSMCLRYSQHHHKTFYWPWVCPQLL